MDEYLPGQPSELGFRAARVVERWLPLWAQPGNYQKLLTNPTQLFDPRRPLDEFGTELQYNARPERLPFNILQHLEIVRRPFEVSAINRTALAKICSLGVAQEFDIFYAMCPICEEALAKPQIRAYHDQVQEMVRRVAARCPRFHLLEPLPIVEKAERMQLVDHMTHAAGVDFTHTVNDRIRALQAASDETCPLSAH